MSSSDSDSDALPNQSSLRQKLFWQLPGVRLDDVYEYEGEGEDDTDPDLIAALQITDVDARITRLVEVFNSYPTTGPTTATLRPDGRPGIILQDGEILDIWDPETLTYGYLMGYPVDVEQVRRAEPRYPEILPLYNICDPKQFVKVVQAHFSDTDYGFSEEDWARVLDPCTNLRQYSLVNLRPIMNAMRIPAVGVDSLNTLLQYFESRSTSGSELTPLWLGYPRFAKPDSVRIAIFTPDAILTTEPIPGIEGVTFGAYKVAKVYSRYPVAAINYIKSVVGTPITLENNMYSSDPERYQRVNFTKPPIDATALAQYIRVHGKNAVVLRGTTVSVLPGDLDLLLRVIKTVLNMLDYGADQIVAIIKDGVVMKEEPASLTQIAARNLRNELREGNRPEIFQPLEQLAIPEELRQRVRFSPPE